MLENEKLKSIQKMEELEKAFLRTLPNLKPIINILYNKKKEEIYKNILTDFETAEKMFNELSTQDLEQRSTFNYEELNKWFDHLDGISSYFIKEIQNITKENNKTLSLEECHELLIDEKNPTYMNFLFLKKLTIDYSKAVNSYLKSLCL